MEIKAQLNYLRIAPRKVRLIANVIKGMKVSSAELELEHLVKRSSLPLLKLLKSAVANARHNFQLDADNLYIKDISVDEGPTLKRSMPRAFGRAAPIRKRASHVSLVLISEDLNDKTSPKKRVGHALDRKAFKGGVKQEGPHVRDITAEDTKEDFLEKSKEARDVVAQPQKKQRTDFVRRMFRRKAI